MKKNFSFVFLLATAAVCFFTSCQKDLDGQTGKPVVINEDGTTSNGSRFVGIDDKNFYLDYIKYTVEEGHLVVSGYDRTGFSGVANIVPAITYKGNAYEVLEFGYGAFMNSTSLTSVTIPNRVLLIGGYAFFGCTGLTSINIPNSVTAIGLHAFYNCTGLTSLTIPQSVTTIRTEAFRGCSGLTSIHCKSTAPPSCSNSSFDDVTYKKAVLYFPKGSLSEYNSANGWKNFVHIQEK